MRKPTELKHEVKSSPRFFDTRRGAGGWIKQLLRAKGRGVFGRSSQRETRCISVWDNSWQMRKGRAEGRDPFLAKDASSSQLSFPTGGIRHKSHDFYRTSRTLDTSWSGCTSASSFIHYGGEAGDNITSQGKLEDYIK